MTTLIAETRIHRMNGISRIVQEAENHGNYFFSPDTLAVFRSIIDDETFTSDDGTYFVTSEQMSGDFWSGTGLGVIPKAFGAPDSELEQEHPRTFRARRATLTDDGFEIVGFEKEFDNRADVIEYARHLAYDEHVCANCGGPLVPCDYKVEFVHDGQSWTDLDTADHMPVLAGAV